jgi:hypothetical protein
MEALEQFRYYDNRRRKVAVALGFPIQILGHPFFVHHALLPGGKQDVDVWVVSEAETGLRVAHTEGSLEDAVRQAERKITKRGGASAIRERIEAYKTEHSDEWAALQEPTP